MFKKLKIMDTTLALKIAIGFGIAVLFYIAVIEHNINKNK